MTHESLGLQLVVPNAGEALRVVLTFEDDLVQADTAK